MTSSRFDAPPSPGSAARLAETEAAHVSAVARRDILTTLMPGFAGTELPLTLRDRLADGLGAVCLFGGNVLSREQLRALNGQISAANPGAVIAIDEEGGDVTRLDHARGSLQPGGALLGRLDDLPLTTEVGACIGRDLRGTGCTLDLAPDADVNSNPDNPVIGVRSFGADAALVARHGAAWIEGIQSTGVGACAKHFPGHGDTALDSHLALPVVDRSLEELRERELVPFRAAIEAGVRSIMTSHILLPQVDAENPATFSRRILQELLRGELGFEGVIVSDALDMKGASGEIGIPEAAVRALAAGVDLLCIGSLTADTTIEEIIDAIRTAVVDGRLAAERVEDAARRVRALAATRTSDDAFHERAGVDLPLARIVEGFHVRAGALAAFRATEHETDPPFAVVRLTSEANVAVGAAPWGPFAEAVADPHGALAVAWKRHPLLDVTDEGAAAGRLEDRLGEVLDAIGPERAVVVVGKGLHRHPFARHAVDRLRAERRTLVVDMGWPSDDRAYADIATFGGSRLLGRALIGLLEGVDGSDAIGGDDAVGRSGVPS